MRIAEAFFPMLDIQLVVENTQPGVGDRYRGRRVKRARSRERDRAAQT
jgi:hypothetical protein